MKATEQHFPVVLFVFRFFVKWNMRTFWMFILCPTECKIIKLQAEIPHDDDDDDEVRRRR